jgi:hypothetical protein
MTHKLGEQIAEVRREIVMRREVYPRQVSNGKLKQKVADYQLACMGDVLATLLSVQEHQEPIRNAVRATKRAKEAA